MPSSRRVYRPLRVYTAVLGNLAHKKFVKKSQFWHMREILRSKWIENFVLALKLQVFDVEISQIHSNTIEVYNPVHVHQNES